MEFVFELVLQFLSEFLLEAFFETIFGSALRRRKRRPSIAAGRFSKPLTIVAYAFWGGLAGGISLFIFPHSLIANPNCRLLNLAITPFLVGGLMAMIGRMRRNSGQVLIHLDYFGYAFSFAVAMSVVRYVWAA